MVAMNQGLERDGNMQQRTVAHEVAGGEIAVWTPWPVNWSAVWIGALAALAAGLILGLVGTALGASSSRSISTWQAVSRLDVIVAVVSAFFAFVCGGWVAGKIAGSRHAEPSILHAAVSWLVSLPLLIILLAAGSGNAFGGWSGGLTSLPLANAAAATASPEAIRDTALAALMTILLGLVGTVIGGWLASGEPMSFTHHRTRKAMYSAPERRTQS
jgi:uncharacterized membrane protein YeaQ/YmgE (transglycosylase-associated protein family)